jgi:hypothetical protein
MVPNNIIISAVSGFGRISPYGKWNPRWRNIARNEEMKIKKKCFQAKTLCAKSATVVTGHAKWYLPTNGIFPLSVASLGMDIAPLFIIVQ